MCETPSLFIFKGPFHVFICAAFSNTLNVEKNVAQVGQNVTRLWKKSRELNAVLNSRAHLMLQQSIFRKKNTWLCIISRFLFYD